MIIMIILTESLSYCGKHKMVINLYLYRNVLIILIIGALDTEYIVHSFMMMIIYMLTTIRPNILFYNL